MDIVHFQNNSSDERPRILVCGATGRQGGAITKWLSGAEGHPVAALTSDAGSPAEVSKRLKNGSNERSNREPPHL